MAPPLPPKRPVQRKAANPLGTLRISNPPRLPVLPWVTISRPLDDYPHMGIPSTPPLLYSDRHA